MEKRFYHINEEGKHIFYVEFILEVDNLYHINTSLDDIIIASGNSDVIGLVEIESQKEFETIFQRIVNIVTHIDGVEVFYFPDRYLDTNQKFCDYTFKTLKQKEEEILTNDSLIDIPLTVGEHGFVFNLVNKARVLKRTYKNVVMLSTEINITKEEFESQLVTDLLRDKYIDVYSNHNTYHKVLENGKISCYLIKDKTDSIVFMIAKDV
jgi:hypothetical protein